MTFTQQLAAAWQKNNSLLCVGLDPDPAKFPAHLKGRPDAILEFCKTIVDATHAALKRNYPDLTRADVAELVDLGNMVEVIQSVMDVAGVKRAELEKKASAATSP